MNEKSELSKIALIKLFILVSACAIAYWPEMAPVIRAVPFSSELAHTAVFPIAAILLVYLRFNILKQNFASGSAWGVVFLSFGILLYSLCIWPFTFGYARQIAIIPSLAGIILMCCGWRFLKCCVPLLFILWLAIPIGPRLYANLSIYPETLTIDVTAKTLNLLPGTDVTVAGNDLLFKHYSAIGAIALGESIRGARLFFASTLIGLFVIFCEVRTKWRIVGAIALSVPVIFLSNFLRLLTESLITIYGGVRVESSLPRDIATALSLLIAYALFASIVYGNWNLYTEEQPVDNPQESKYAD
jgi:exosortase/archaeosortase family protein